MCDHRPLVISPWEVEEVVVSVVVVEAKVAEEVAVVGDAQFSDASENCAENCAELRRKLRGGGHLQLCDRQRGLDPPVLERVLEEHV